MSHTVPVSKTGHVSSGDAQFIIFNVEGVPKKVKPISFFVTRDGNKYSLYKFVEEYYQHPDVPEEEVGVSVTRYDIRHVCTYYDYDPKCSPLIVLYAAQINIDHVVQKLT